MAVVTVPLQVRFADVDMAHHVHNAVYLHWFELARMALLRTFIPEGHDWKSQGLILARNELDYRVPVQLADRVEADCWCSAVGTKSFDLRYAVRRINGAPVVCTEGRSVMVCFDYTHGRSVPLPPTWRAELEKMVG